VNIVRVGDRSTAARAAESAAGRRERRGRSRFAFGRSYVRCPEVWQLLVPKR